MTVPNHSPERSSEIARNIIKIAALEHFATKPWDALTATLEEKFAEAIDTAIQEEREACAKVADEKYINGCGDECVDEVAKAIRARGNK